MSRPPSEIMAVFDQAQDELERADPGTYDLRALLWEVLNDVLNFIDDDGGPERWVALQSYVDDNYGDNK